MPSGKKLIETLLAKAGIGINGRKPWDVQVRDERFYARILRSGSLGLGEAYMDGWWESDSLDEFFNRVLRARLDEEVGWKWQFLPDYLRAWLGNLQNQARAEQNAQHHYDIGHDLYQAMLDRRMVYTGAYWKEAMTLDQAQEAKLDLVCRKLDLQPDQYVLDIGCGWGSFARYAAEKYGARVLGITVSRDQAQLGSEMCKGLPVQIRLQDYREVEGKFDHIVSLGMIEHVGYKNYRTYMKVVSRSLSDKGLFLLQTIGGNRSDRSIDPWLDRYIFPNAVLPSAKQLTKAMEGLMVLEDWHSFGLHYDLTLMAWYRNIEQHWPELKPRYSDRFYRMWKYYLLSCAGAFRARKTQLWQLVISRYGVENGYSAIR